MVMKGRIRNHGNGRKSGFATIETKVKQGDITKEMNHTTRTGEAGRGVGRSGVNYGYQFRLFFDCGTGRATCPCTMHRL
jgi:hypothetical protein